MGMDLRHFEISTPSRLGELISPARPKQVYEHLDDYYESYKKAGEVIFEEAEAREYEEEESELERARRIRKREGRVHDITTRWDYDEKITISKP